MRKQHARVKSQRKEICKNKEMSFDLDQKLPSVLSKFEAKISEIRDEMSESVSELILHAGHPMGAVG